MNLSNMEVRGGFIMPARPCRIMTFLLQFADKMMKVR
jgi:hypothetical protein